MKEVESKGNSIRQIISGKLGDVRKTFEYSICVQTSMTLQNTCTKAVAFCYRPPNASSGRFCDQRTKRLGLKFASLRSCSHVFGSVQKSVSFTVFHTTYTRFKRMFALIQWRCTSDVLNLTKFISSRDEFGATEKIEVMRNVGGD